MSVLLERIEMKIFTLFLTVFTLFLNEVEAVVVVDIKKSQKIRFIECPGTIMLRVMSYFMWHVYFRMETMIARLLSRQAYFPQRCWYR